MIELKEFNIKPARARVGRLINIWERENIHLVTMTNEWFFDFVAIYKEKSINELIAMYYKFKYLLNSSTRTDLNVRNRKMYTVAYLLQQHNLTYADLEAIKEGLLKKIREALKIIDDTCTSNMELVKAKDTEMKYPEIALFYYGIKYFEGHNYYHLRKALYFLKQTEEAKNVSK